LWRAAGILDGIPAGRVPGSGRRVKTLLTHRVDFP
jgi:hypothetical protein